MNRSETVFINLTSAEDMVLYNAKKDVYSFSVYANDKTDLSDWIEVPVESERLP